MKKYYILTALFVFIIFTLRIYIDSYNHLKEAELALSSQKYDQAIYHLGRSARSYFITNDIAKKSLFKLQEIAIWAENEQNAKKYDQQRDSNLLALSAYQEIRTSCLSLRGFFIPHDDILLNANKKIAHIQSSNNSGDSRSEKEKKFLSLLAKIEDPSPFWSMISSLSFISWVVFGIISCIKGFDSNGNIIKSKVKIFGILTVASYFVWISGMFLA